MPTLILDVSLCLPCNTAVEMLAAIDPHSHLSLVGCQQRSVTVELPVAPWPRGTSQQSSPPVTTWPLVPV